MALQQTLLTGQLTSGSFSDADVSAIQTTVDSNNKALFSALGYWSGPMGKAQPLVPSNTIKPFITASTTTQIASAQNFPAVPSSIQGSYDTNHFYLYAGAVGVEGAGTPGVTAAIVPDSTGPQGASFTASFYHTGSAIEIVKLNSGQPFALWVDDNYVGYFAPDVANGTSQGGGAVNTFVLAAGASATNGQYNQYTILITAGTGIGQFRQILSYVGATKTATVASNWTVTPDATSVYSLVEDGNGYHTISGATNFINLNWGYITTHKIDVVSFDFAGVNIGPLDSVYPAQPSAGAARMVVIGDSELTIIQGPHPFIPPIWAGMGRLMGCNAYIDGVAGTGLVYNNAAASLNYMDRIAPPLGSWVVNLVGAFAGTYTLTVSSSGFGTATTAAIAFNAGAAGITTALNAILPSGTSFYVSNWGGENGYGKSAVIIFRKNPDAVVSANFTSTTKNTPPGCSVFPYLGGVATRVPKDGSGNPLPFLLIVQGSSNDSAGNSITTQQIQAAAQYIAQSVQTRFPTAILVFTGVLWISTIGGSGVISASDVAMNTAIKAGAAAGPFVNGQTSFIDTYAAGIGANSYIYGTGTIANPTTNKNDILISVATAGHATGDGQSLLWNRVIQATKTLLGAG